MRLEDLSDVITRDELVAPAARKLGTRTEVRRPIRKDRHGRPLPTGISWDAERKTYRVYVYAGGRQVCTRFPADATIREMREWRDGMREVLRDQARNRAAARQRDVPPSGTLRAAAAAYLATVTAMPSYEARRVDLEAWYSRFGERRLDEITTTELDAQLNDWDEVGVAINTRNHRRTALLECVRKHAPHLMERFRAMKWTKPPKRPARGIPYEDIVEIFEAMPPSRTRAGLQIMAYTGLPPALIRQFAKDDVDLRGARAYVGARDKGEGVDGVVLPLMPQAVEAFREWDRFNGWRSAFTSGGYWLSFRRAVTKVNAARVKAGQPLIRAKLRPYDLRHSFGAFAFRHTKDLAQVQELMRHARLETTMQYAGAALQDVLRHGVKKLGQMMPSTAPRLGTGSNVTALVEFVRRQ